MKSLAVLLLLIFSISAKALTLGTYNIRNFDYDERYRISTNKVELSNILHTAKADILSVEEIKNTAEFDRFVSSKLPGFDAELTRCGGAHGQRLGFIYNKNTIELLSFHEDLAISNPGRQEQCDSGSRPLAVALFRVKATGQKLYGLSAHLKSGSQSGSLEIRKRQFEVIKKLINELKGKTGVKDFFLGGDLNTTSFITRGPDYKMLAKLVQDLGMINLTESVPCTSYWWGGIDNGIESPSVLDHLLVTPGLLKNGNARLRLGAHCQKASCREVAAQELGVSYSSVSDHCPISAVVQ